MKTEKHCSVIDAEGRHVTYVLVKIRDKPLEDGGTEQVEEVQNYTLKDGEQLVDAQPPVMRTARRQHRLCLAGLGRLGLAGDRHGRRDRGMGAGAPGAGGQADTENQRRTREQRTLSSSSRFPLWPTSRSFYEDCIAEMAEIVYA